MEEGKVPVMPLSGKFISITTPLLHVTPSHDAISQTLPAERWTPLPTHDHPYTLRDAISVESMRSHIAACQTGGGTVGTAVGALVGAEVGVSVGDTVGIGVGDDVGGSTNHI